MLAGIVMVFLAVLQVGITGMTHVLLVGAAADAARGVAVTRDATVGQARIEPLAALPFMNLSERSIGQTWIDGLPLTEVRVTARVIALLPWGGREVSVVRHSLMEGP